MQPPDVSAGTAINPNQAVPIDTIGFDTTNDLNPCTISRYPADRLIPSCLFVNIPFVTTNDNRVQTRMITTTLKQFQTVNASRLKKFLAMKQGPGLNPMQKGFGAKKGQMVLPQQNVLAPVISLKKWMLLLPPNWGILYLNQLRIRPAGSILGELVYTLGLGPLEKVTLTQTTYTRKTTSIESMTDSSQETSTEFDSTFSHDLAENTQQAMNTQNTQSFGVNGSVGYSGYASVGANYSNSTSQGMQTNQQQSVKDSRQITSKVSTKAKIEHKITFKTETETGVENIAQRVFQNPNTAHTLMLNFYKILQRYGIFQEQYGAVMCWAPTMEDPGAEIRHPWEKKISEKIVALNAVKTWVPDDLPQPQPIQSYSDWVDVPIKQLMKGNNNDSLGLWGTFPIVGLNVGTQIQIPQGYELDPTQWCNPQPPGANVYVKIESVPQSGIGRAVNVEVTTNLPNLPGWNLNLKPLLPINIPCQVYVSGPTSGTYTPPTNGNAPKIEDGNQTSLSPPVQQLAKVGQVSWTDIPNESAASSNSSASPSGSAGSPSATTVHWYVAVFVPSLINAVDPAVKDFPFLRIRTVFMAVPTDDTITTYNQLLASRRQSEYQARLTDLQHTITAAQAALADGATFDPTSETLRQLVMKQVMLNSGQLLPNPSNANPFLAARNADVLSLWLNAFDWNSVTYIMGPAWMNPNLDNWVDNAGNPLQPQILSGLQGSGQDSTNPPYAIEIPPIWRDQPTTLATAAWVQVFIPIISKQENTAASLTTGGQYNNPAAIATLVRDLQNYQQSNFGTPTKPSVVQLAAWQEFMPTDGTFVDATLGMCPAADSLLMESLQSQSDLRSAQATALQNQVGNTPDQSQDPNKQRHPSRKSLGTRTKRRKKRRGSDEDDSEIIDEDQDT